MAVGLMPITFTSTPMLLAVTPLPIPDSTPPVTTINLVSSEGLLCPPLIHDATAAAAVCLRLRLLGLGWHRPAASTAVWWRLVRAPALKFWAALDADAQFAPLTVHWRLLVLISLL